MNIGYEDDDLIPFIEPLPDFNDPIRIGNLWVSLMFCDMAFRSALGKSQFEGWKYVKNVLEIQISPIIFFHFNFLLRSQNKWICLFSAKFHVCKFLFF